MSTNLLDALITWLPPAFMVAGLLTTSGRIVCARRKQSQNPVGVDPDIRVRVTGKIS